MQGYAASDAVMDPAMVIAASMHEIVQAGPGTGPAELIKSGLSVGRLVVGAMTTTLLPACSRGCIVPNSRDHPPNLTRHVPLPSFAD